jgi:hypothetical protein
MSSRGMKRSAENEKKRRDSGRRKGLKIKDLIELPEKRMRNVLKSSKKATPAKVVHTSHQPKNLP